MQSMTGYGHSSFSFPEHDISIDVKTVNGRYFDFKARLPRELMPYEVEFQKRVQRSLSRGRIEVFVEVAGRLNGRFDLNESVVNSYRSLAARLNSLGIAGDLSVPALFQLPGVIVAKQREASSETLLTQALQVLETALDQVKKARGAEGHDLKLELERLLGLLKTSLKGIQQRSGQITDYYREKLRQRIESLLKDQPIDLNRLAQELIFHSERSDVSEEIARLFSHIRRFESFLVESEKQPTGKDLDFLCQEMNREMNTVLSKSQLAEVSELAVTAKGLVEKLREQVQNVE